MTSQKNSLSTIRPTSRRFISIWVIVSAILVSSYSDTYSDAKSSPSVSQAPDIRLATARIFIHSEPSVCDFPCLRKHMNSLCIMLCQTSRLVSICVCRFLLALRQVYTPDHEDESQLQSGRNGDSRGRAPWLRVSSRYVANIGAPLSFSNEDYNYSTSHDDQDHELIPLSEFPLTRSSSEKSIRIQR